MNLPCGHPPNAVMTSDEGTSYCMACELDTRIAEVAKLKAQLHDLQSASWADAVQDAAAWRERALVAEKALEKRPVFEKAEKLENVLRKILVTALWTAPHSNTQPYIKCVERVEKMARDALDLTEAEIVMLIEKAREGAI